MVTQCNTDSGGGEVWIKEWLLIMYSKVIQNLIHTYNAHYNWISFYWTTDKLNFWRFYFYIVEISTMLASYLFNLILFLEIFIKYTSHCMENVDLTAFQICHAV